MVKQDIILRKINFIVEHLDRLKGKGQVPLKTFLTNTDIQDIVLRNLQVVIQGCCDLAMHIVSEKEWGLPATFGGVFDILLEKKVIKPKIHQTMLKMVGFRNFIVHQYDDINMETVYINYTERLGDVRIFLKDISRFARL